MYSFENKPEMIECEEYGVKYYEFLTTAQIGIIAKQMLEYDTYHEREYVKNILMAKYLTDIPEDFDYDKYYDNMCVDGFFDWLCGVAFISEDKIYKATKQSESIMTQLTLLIKTLEEFSHKMPENLDMNDLKKYFSKLVKRDGYNK